ncbi:hypothetical protein NEAUS04_0115 [Nematocida ausubeli]|nr:hypothetical protein NEAUS07_2181 [Nematocida ausubeli]KAI5150775.1 hypothetical protein NEAUS05_2293 [Nematocida ausubeli]KAI5160741.1 hypothetical protein NEAUS04_0115 [Nematocida ausubeli]
MTKSNISRRENQLEADENTASHPRMVGRYSAGGGRSITFFQILQFLDIEHGRTVAQRDLKMFSLAFPEWRDLEPRGKLFLIMKELSTRRGPRAKRINAPLHTLIYSDGTPLEEWTEEFYDEVIEDLLQRIERERKSPLGNVPKKGNNTWYEWFAGFSVYLWQGTYSFEDVAVEFQLKTMVYPRSFSEIWLMSPRTFADALRRLLLECKRLDTV